MILRIKILVYRYYNLFTLFWIPNFKFLIKNNKNVKLGSNIRFNQFFKIRGAGKINIGNNTTFGYKSGGFHRSGSIEIQARGESSTITLGDNITTNNNIFICSSGYIKVCSNTLIGQGVTIMDFEAHGTDPSKRREVGEVGKVDIGENVWIGNNVTILKNTSIGKNSIVAAGAVVKGDFPNNVIIGGIPAKIIKIIE